jgi:hypothetical protein
MQNTDTRSVNNDMEGSFWICFLHSECGRPDPGRDKHINRVRVTTGKEEYHR